jgi:hypothetical protein
MKLIYCVILTEKLAVQLGCCWLLQFLWTHSEKTCEEEQQQRHGMMGLYLPPDAHSSSTQWNLLFGKICFGIG